MDRDEKEKKKKESKSMMRKKIAVAAIAGIMAVSLMAMPMTNVFAAQETVTESEAECAAVNFEKLPVTVLSDMDDYDLKAGLTWEIKWNAKLSDKNSCVRYGKFTITKDSYVRIKTSSEGSRPDFGWEEDYYIYGNSSMGTAVYSHSAAGSDDYYEMKAGIYYIKMEGTFSYWIESTSNTEKMIIGCVAKEDAVKLTQTPNKTKSAVVIKVDEKIMSNGKGSIKIAEGNNENVIDWGNYSNDYTDISSTGRFTVKKNGWYVVQVTVESPRTWGKDVYSYKKIKVNCIDNVKPVVAGFKDKGAYNKAVKITFRDNNGGSGIKSATLNGKKIKNGTVVNKEGKYTLKVADNAGNVKAATFIIDKTKPIVTGVKNKQTYKKAVKIVLKDNPGGSSLWKATMNGKYIKKVTTVSKPGKYTLKVKDKAGNLTTVTFAIKK